MLEGKDLVVSWVAYGRAKEKKYWRGVGQEVGDVGLVMVPQQTKHGLKSDLSLVIMGLSKGWTGALTVNTSSLLGQYLNS